MGKANPTPDDYIVELYWQRSEFTIHETAVKYGDYCHHIAYNIQYFPVNSIQISLQLFAASR